MNNSTASNTAGPTVPPQLQPQERVYLNGPEATVCSGLYVFKVYRNGTSFATAALLRIFPDEAMFELHASIKGDVEIRGHYQDCDTGQERQHSFGFTHVN